MLITNYCLTRKIAVLASVLAAIQPLTTQSASESDRLEKLERAVEQLQKRNVQDQQYAPNALAELDPRFGYSF